MKFGKLAAIAATITLILGISPAFAATNANDPIKVGVYLPLTGQNAFGGQLELDGIKLANKEMPEVLGRPIELVIVDNKSDKVEAANAVKRLIERDKVCAFIGTYGSALAMAGAEIAEKAKVPGLGTSCTNPLVTQGKEYYFRGCFIDPYQADAIAAYVKNNLGFTKAAILMDVTNDYAVGLGKYFTDSFKKVGGDIVSTLKYNSGDQDFTAQLTELIKSDPQIVFMPAYFAEGAIIMKQAKELGAKFRLMGADAMDNPDTVKIGGDAVEGFLHTTFPYAADMPNMSEEAKKFTEAWKKEYPDRETNANGLLGYNCYLLIREAIQKAGSDDPKAIAKAMSEIEGLPTALGKITINKTHDAEMPVGIIEYKNGKRVYVGEVTPNN